MFSPLRNASILSATTLISEQEEPIESGNNTETWCLAVTPGLESRTRKIFGWSPKTDHSITTGPKGVGRMQKDDLPVSLFFMRLTLKLSRLQKSISDFPGRSSATWMAASRNLKFQPSEMKNLISVEIGLPGLVKLFPECHIRSISSFSIYQKRNLKPMNNESSSFSTSPGGSSKRASKVL